MIRSLIILFGREIVLNCYTSTKVTLVALFRMVKLWNFVMIIGRTCLSRNNGHICIASHAMSTFHYYPFGTWKNLLIISTCLNLKKSMLNFSNFLFCAEIWILTVRHIWTLPDGASKFKVSQTYQQLSVGQLILPAIKQLRKIYSYQRVILTFVLVL